MWECRILDTMAEFNRVVDLEIKVWNLDPHDAVPANILHAIHMNGGLIAGVYDRDQLVGMSLAFPGRREKNSLLWSHMAGVDPAYQGQGIGFTLKQFQRSWALEHGYRVMGWTFDPLQRGNANFNLHYLGATADSYHVNLYGEMTDGINAGLPSDRLEVTWDLRNPRVKRLAVSGQKMDAGSGQPTPTVLLSTKDTQQPVLTENVLGSARLLIEIPPDLSSLKRANPNLAYEWRMALRKAFQLAFSRHYRAEDFVTDGERCGYILSSPSEWYLYVLECGDQTLYTGVTTDLSKRVVRHNAGRGAAYTASRRPVRLIGAWKFASRSLALKAEVALKKRPRHIKLALVAQKAAFMDAPFAMIDGEAFDPSGKGND